MTITLLDGVAHHAKHPTTFPIPSDAAKAAVMKGDLVKLVFSDGTYNERMWVLVTGPNTGVLDNNPFELAMRWGDPVSFEPRHIVAIASQVRGAGQLH